MNRSSSLTKFMQKQSLEYSDEDSMQSESVYTRGVFGDNDYADDSSCASSIASSGIFGLQLESSVRRLSSHHGLEEEDTTTPSSSSRGSILYDDIEKQQNEKDGLDWDMESKAVDVRNDDKSDDVSETSNSSGEESSSENSSSDESSVRTAAGKGPLACYRNSSRRFKIALFIILALLLAFLTVALLMLFGVIDHGVLDTILPPDKSSETETSVTTDPVVPIDLAPPEN